MVEGHQFQIFAKLQLLSTLISNRKLCFIGESLEEGFCVVSGVDSTHCELDTRRNAHFYTGLASLANGIYMSVCKFKQAQNQNLFL